MQLNWHQNAQRKVDLFNQMYELDSRQYEACLLLFYFESFKFVFLKAFRSSIAPRMNE